MNEVQFFSNPRFGDIRVIMNENSEPLFVANDIAKSLGYTNPRKAVADHCKSRGVTKRDIPINGVNQTVTFIDESNLYRLVMRSNLPDVEPYQDWVCDEVLPSIRKHGAYMTDAKIEEIISDPDTIIRLATQLKAERAEKERLALTMNEQSKQLKLQAPKVEYCDKVLSSEGLLTVTMIADNLGISEIKLNRLLKEWKIQYQESGTYHLYTKYRDKGYTEHKPYPYTDSLGRPKTRQHMYWTERGKMFILDMYSKYQEYLKSQKGIAV